MNLRNARAIPITSSALNCPPSLCHQLSTTILARTCTSEMLFYLISGQAHEIHLYFVYYRMFIVSLRFLSVIFIVFRLLVATRVLRLVPVNLLISVYETI